MCVLVLSRSRLPTDGCLVTDKTKKMAKNKARDFSAWTDDEMELLLKVTQEYKPVMVVANRLGVIAKQKR